LFFHGISFSTLLSYLVPLDRLQPYNKKGQQVVTCSPLIESKGVTRATNAIARYHESAATPSEFVGASL
jgi:hypothetical protein